MNDKELAEHYRMNWSMFDAIMGKGHMLDDILWHYLPPFSKADIAKWERAGKS